MGYINCDNKDLLPIEELFKNVILKDSNGKHYVNVIFDEHNNCNDALAAMDCDSAQRETAETMWRKAFDIDACGNLALRIGSSTT